MISGLPVDHYIDAMLPALPEYYDVAVGIDGRLVDRDNMPMVADGCTLSLVVVPQGGDGGAGKMVLKIVGAVIIAIAAAYTGGAAAGLYSGYGAAAGASAGISAASLGSTAAMAVGYTAAAGVAIAGTMIMNAVLPVNTARASSGQQPSATYSWDVTSNSVLEGSALPALFGTHRIFPPRIGGYVEGNGEKQTLNLLFAIAGHQVDSITDVKINDTALVDYPECTIETRLGTNNQQIIQAFGDTTTIVSTGAGLPLQLSDTWVTLTTQGNIIDRLAFGIWFPSGLCWIPHGEPVSALINIAIEYKLHADATWTKLQSTTSEPTAVITDYWSAGYWFNGTYVGLMWIELEAGTTTVDAHVEGEKYEPDPSVWATNNYASDEYEKPITIWHWVTSGNYVLPAGTTLDYFTIVEAKLTPLRYVKYSPSGLPPGQYDIRMKLADPLPSSDPAVIADAYWEYYSEIIEDDLTYPNVPCLSVRSVATNKLSGSIPRVSCLAARSTVLVYDTSTSAYVSVAATNPAWACYDILHGARSIVDINAAGYDPADDTTWTMEILQTGPIPHSRIIYADFYAWAAWCDDTTGGKLAYTCNIYLDNTMNVRKALDMVGLLGRGSVVQQGAYFSCVVERTETLPVQRFLFNVANILKDSYTEEWLPLDERSNAIELTYYDSTDDYRPKNIEIYQAGFDESVEEVKKSSMDLRGCVDRDMATRFGKFLLNCNRYLSLTASWTADVDAIACAPGSIIEVQHDVPQYGYGGRLLSGCTDTVLLLDGPVTLAAATTYHILINHQADDLREVAVVLPVVVPPGSVWRGTWDGGETYAVGDAAYFVATADYQIKTAAPDTWTVCGTTGETIVIVIDETVTDPAVSHLLRAPIVDTRYTFGAVGQLCKLMRVIRISRSSEQKHKITAVEFVNEVYDDTATSIPVESPSDLPRQIFPPALQSVDVEIIWKLDAALKEWIPYIRFSFLYDPAVDYVNLAIPISKIRIYFHQETGDTTADPLISQFETVLDWNGGAIDIPAGPAAGKTLYTTAALVNIQGMEGSKCAVDVFYVDISFTPAPTTSNLTIDSYDYAANGTSGYIVYFSWVPYGWVLDTGKYEPILDWNSGSNYYVFARYMVVWGIVDNTGDIPLLAEMMSYQTVDIGNIFDADGTMITDADSLDSICRGAASGSLKLSYNDKWVAIAAAPVMKNLTSGVLDLTQDDYGLDWEWIQVTCPGGTGATVEDVQIQNAEIVYTQQAGGVYLNELNWDYSLQSPAIDGFAVIFRAQPYHWAWAFDTTVAVGETNLTTILTALDLTTYGGTAAATDFASRYAEWSAGSPHWYMLISDNTNYEIIQIDTTTFAVTRGVEGTTARQWAAGAVLSYSPCELIDTFASILDTTQRSFTFTPPLEINFALHCTIIAVKIVPGSPGYKRCHYAHWDAVRLR